MKGSLAALAAASALTVAACSMAGTDTSASPGAPGAPVTTSSGAAPSTGSPSLTPGAGDVDAGTDAASAPPDAPAQGNPTNGSPAPIGTSPPAPPPPPPPPPTPPSPPTAPALPSFVGRVLVASRHVVETTATGTSASLRLGSYSFAATSGAASDYLFRPDADSLPWNTTDLNTPMDVAAIACTPGPLQIPAYQAQESAGLSWSGTDASLVIAAEGMHETWTEIDAVHAIYQLTAVTFDDGGTASDVHGYGAMADSDTTPGGRAALASDFHDYSGEICQRAGGAASFVCGVSQFNFSLFSAPAGYLDMLGLTQYDASEGMYVQHSILFDYAPANEAIFYHSYGHDFNQDHCFDELGHTSMNMAVYDATGAVQTVITAETSYETSGYPVVTVGYYTSP